jgi:hypothetical protein
MLAKPAQGKGSLADSGRQPEERLHTDVRALRAIVAVDLKVHDRRVTHWQMLRSCERSPGQC